MELLWAFGEFGYACWCKAVFRPAWMCTTSALFALSHMMGIIMILVYVSHRNRMSNE